MSAAAPEAASVARINHPAARALTERHRLRWWETLPWIAAIGGLVSILVPEGASTPPPAGG